MMRLRDRPLSPLSDDLKLICCFWASLLGFGIGLKRKVVDGSMVILSPSSTDIFLGKSADIYLQTDTTRCVIC